MKRGHTCTWGVADKPLHFPSSSPRKCKRKLSIAESGSTLFSLTLSGRILGTFSLVLASHTPGTGAGFSHTKVAPWRGKFNNEVGWLGKVTH